MSPAPIRNASCKACGMSMQFPPGTTDEEITDAMDAHEVVEHPGTVQELVAKVNALKAENESLKAALGRGQPGEAGSVIPIAPPANS